MPRPDQIHASPPPPTDPPQPRPDAPDRTPSSPAEDADRATAPDPASGRLLSEAIERNDDPDIDPVPVDPERDDHLDRLPIEGDRDK